MIERGIELLRALAAAPSGDTRASAIAHALRKPDASAADTADAIAETIAAVPQRDRKTETAWTFATAAAAAIAAVLAAHALVTLYSLMRPEETSLLSLLPLLALPIACAAIIAWSRSRRAERERLARLIAGELERKKIDAHVAYEAGCFLAGHDGKPAPTTRAVTAKIIPALAVGWVVVAFWSLYYWTIGQVSW